MYLNTTRQFTATQKGQLSVNESHEFELVSDSHWYWWFVRVRGSGAEGFIPAEIVELPRERIARLNRQLNTKLSQEPLALRGNKIARKKSVRFSDPIWEAEPIKLELEVAAPVSPVSDDSDSDSSADTVSLSSVSSNESDTGLVDVKNGPTHVHIQDTAFDGFDGRIAVQAL